jgi:hypothetical protein
VDKLSVFFRAFDITFFAPGVVILLALHHNGDLDWLNLHTELTKAEGLLGFGAMICLTYVLGLICHGLQRVLFEAWTKDEPESIDVPQSQAARKRSWYESLQPEKQEDIAIYFWYLRATCRSLTVALILIVLYLLFAPLELVSVVFSPVVIAFVSAIVLFWLGSDYERALRKISKYMQIDQDAAQSKNASSKESAK